MVCLNQELRLEIDNGFYYRIIGEPEISDRINSHGSELSITIKIDSNGSLPKQGAIGFLTRLLGSTRTKLFGGICGAVNPKLGIKGDDLSLQFNSFATEYASTAIQPNLYTQKENTLTGHIRNLAQLAKLYADVEATRQLINVLVFPDPETDIPFIFDFTNGGTLAQALDQICSQRNCNWNMESAGGTEIAGLPDYNAILYVRSNIYLSTVAPRTELRIDDTSCAFWDSGTLNYSEIEPQASQIDVYGKNGLNIPESGIALLNPDVLKFIAQANQSDYPEGISRTADEVIKILVTKPMQDPIEFTKVDFKTLADPNNPIPESGSNQAVIRAENYIFYVNPDDVPEGSLVQVFHITRFIKSTVIVDSAKIYFKQVAQGAGTGIKIHSENRPEIVDQATCDALANSLATTLCYFNFLINFGTSRVKGWKAGQQFRAIHEARDINYLVTITDVKIKLRSGGRDFYSVSAGTIRIMNTEDVTNMQLDKLTNPSVARLPIFTPGLSE